MPVAKVQMPDGRIGRFEVPEGTTEQQVLDFVAGSIPKPPRAWSDVPMEALGNLPESFGNLVADTVRPILHPIDTAESLASLGKGAYKNVAGGYDPNDPDVRAADAVGQLLKERYTTGEGIKNYIATDPAGALGDLATILTAGGGLASRAPGAVGRAGALARTAGRMIDPIAAPVNVAAKAVKHVGAPALTHILGTTTGAQAQPIREAAKAGAASLTDDGGRFLPHMRGAAHTNEIVDQAKTAVNNLKRARGDAYRASSGWKTDPSTLDFAPVEKAYTDLYKSMTVQGHLKVGKETARKLQEIGDVLTEWKSDPALHTVEGFDALKQRIDELMPPRTDPGQSGRAVTAVRNAVKDALVKQAPAYAETMRDYETASSLIKELETGLSLGNKAQADTSLRKLLSIMRNNANTNFGRRKELGDVLVGAGASDLMPMMAGEALNSWTPRGLQQLVASGGIGVAAATQSPLAAILLTQSPRMVGEGAYYAGKAGAAVGDVAKRLQSMIQPVTPTDIGQLLYQSGRAAEESRKPMKINVRNIRGR